MKKAQKALREFDILSAQTKQIEEIIKHTKSGKLWNIEAAVRKKIKALNDLKDKQFNSFDVVYKKYLQLLDEISARLLEHYNKKNDTDYKFGEIVETDRKGYINSGIISVLITSHIPRMTAEEFTKYFPENPKDEYEAARAMKRTIYMHLGDTNTGKTYNALERLKQAKSGVYLAPLRILALENFEKLNRENTPCSLITGEEEIIVENANHVSSTIEKLKIEKTYEVAVIDEIQMISNSQRGQAWTSALLGLKCSEIHVCGAMNAKDLIIKILGDCIDNFEIKEYSRQTPLVVYEKSFELRDAAKGDAIVAFSKRRVLELSKIYQMKGIMNSVIYGDLPPEVRRMQYEAFIRGKSNILITTDAIGMGVNLPIKRIIFMDIQKFDGEEIRYLTTQEVKQIGGRAGRKGIYDVGYVGSVNSVNQQFIKDCLEMKDEDLEKAVIGPSEAILKIKSLPLREKIALWSTEPVSLDYYRKMDVRDYLLVLDVIKYYKLPETDQYKLMKIPFDVNDDELMLCFVGYVEEFYNKNKEQLTKPRQDDGTLFEMERYYQKINLYYSFSKNFNIPFDEKWVYKERENVSKKINSLLLKL
ncbi:MAG: mitochondrial ATP-dependent helicase suv3precursor [Clostridia bacterium]|nr:mitochondrial ATP-dependent helicase suv3precursor [Clostridia bacterium]